jgi:hypothetical protein
VNKEFPLPELNDMQDALPRQFGRFIVDGIAGRGRFGRTYLGRGEDGTKVMVRTVELPLDDERRRALAEALLRLCAAPLDHPAISRPLAAGVEQEVPFIVYEHLPGEPLDALLARDGKQSLATLLPSLTRIAAAIDFAAAAGVHHGALSTQDLIVRADTGGVTGLGLLQAVADAGLPVSPADDLSALSEIITAAVDTVPPAPADTGSALSLVAALQTRASEAPARAAAVSSSPVDERTTTPRESGPKGAEDEAVTRVRGERQRPRLTIDVGPNGPELKLAAPKASSGAPQPAGKKVDGPPQPAKREATDAPRFDWTRDEPDLTLRRDDPVAAALPDVTLHGASPHSATVVDARLTPVEQTVAGESARADRAKAAAPAPPPHVPAVPSRELFGVSSVEPPVSVQTRSIRRRWPLAVAALVVGLVGGFAGGYVAGQGGALAGLLPATRTAARNIPAPPRSASNAVDPATANRGSQGVGGDGSPRPVEPPRAAPTAPQPVPDNVPGASTAPPPAAIPPTVRESAPPVAPSRTRDAAAAGAARSAARARTPNGSRGAPAASSQATTAARGVAASGPGSIQVLSRPAGAQVFVDGRLIGVTPTSLDLPAGNHAVRMYLAGYRAWTTNVEVLAGAPTRVAASLEMNN